MQIKQLLELETAPDIEQKLGRLPDELKGAYREIYAKVAKSKHAKALVDRACMWVMCAYEPLTTVELIGAICIDPDDNTFRLTCEVDEDLLLRLCKYLLILDSQRKVWRFSHLSVAEYFEDNNLGRPQAHCHAAKVCLKLLIEAYKEPSEARDIFHPKHQLQFYSRNYWIGHVQTQEGQEADTVLADQLKAFLGSPGESSLEYREWHRRVFSDPYGRAPTSVLYNINSEDISPENASIFAICRFSFYTLLSDWWGKVEIAISQTNKRGDNLLALAAMGGCRPICKALLERGIHINTQSQYSGSTLAAAVAYSGETEILKFLIQEGKADVNMLLQYGEYGSALAAAAHSEKTEIIKFLAQEGKADVNMLLQCGDYGSALTAAAYWGRTEIIKFLVQEGKADVNMLLHSREYGSALAAAAYQGWKQCVESLINAGAKVNLKLENGLYETALQAAQADVTKRLWWDQRDEEELKQDKAEVMELLQRHGATNED